MAFDSQPPRMACSTCGTPMTAVMLLKTEGAPHGEPGHSFTYRLSAVMACARCNAGYLERYDHDCYPTDEPLDWLSYHSLSADDIARFLAYAKACGDPLNPACGCATHEALGAATEKVRMVSWSARSRIAPGGFEVRAGRPVFTPLREEPTK